MNLKQIREMSDNICNYRVRIATLEAEVTHITSNITVLTMTATELLCMTQMKLNLDLCMIQSTRD